MGQEADPLEELVHCRPEGPKVQENYRVLVAGLAGFLGAEEFVGFFLPVI